MKEILYEDFPSYFVWNNKDHFWSRRQRGHQLGRLAAVHPSTDNGELFCLCCLLKHVPGATSFTNSRTIHGRIYPTYRAACIALELLEDDLIWKKTLEEATLWARPKYLHSLFVTIFIICSTS